MFPSSVVFGLVVAIITLYKHRSSNVTVLNTVYFLSWGHKVRTECTVGGQKILDLCINRPTKLH